MSETLTIAALVTRCYQPFSIHKIMRNVMLVSKQTMLREIDLLYYDNHYVWIKNFSRIFHDIIKIKF